ncbi:uncharacterized protein LOC101736845 [Bombyx mori]|uniref:Uncharacterized protein n=1 Tax=Bombyx mori TaxID=7091 RepID=A0A8R1WGU7_BOMMO|nr:uncharacterized protein LOC101736845 [Bombyx mori]
MLQYYFIYYCFILTQCIHTYTLTNQDHALRNVKEDEDPKYEEKRFRRDKDLALFNLDDFITKDNEGSYDYNSYNKRNNRPSMGSDYNYLLDDLGNKVEDSLRYKDKPAELNSGPSEYEDIMNNGYVDLDALSENKGFVLNDDESANKMRSRDDLLISRSDVQTTGKKCAFKEMKIPFFFHNKSPKNKKAKKRKTCANCKKNEVPKSTKATTTDKSKSKRSQEFKICPVCNKRYSIEFETDSEKIGVTPKMIHNSRQYFAEILKKDNNKSLPNAEEDYDNGLSFIDDKRLKRYSSEENILKELDEVQKKVDNVDINLPNFEKRNLI